ncbi:MAG: hemerythrin domain-containing protein [Pirellulaceae bacterium]
MSSSASLPTLPLFRMHAASVSTHDRGDPGDASVIAPSLAKLIDRIVQTHHGFLRRELPRTQNLLGRVSVEQGARHPELDETARVFAALRAELTAQLAKEEQILFPAIKRLEAPSDDRVEIAAGLTDVLWVFETEHRRAIEALSRLRWLTAGYVTPGDGDALYARLMSQLSELEADLHVHIDTECNLLFPTARRLAEK